MDEQAFEALRLRMMMLTPVFTNDFLELLKRDPELTQRYGTGLFEVASQGTVAFRDVLLGAVQFQHPGFLTSEMQWLDKLLEARQINSEAIPNFISVFRTRIEQDLPTEQAAPLLTTLSEAMQRFHNKKDNYVKSK